MLIDVIHEKGKKISVDENTALCIPEIRAVLQKENQGAAAVAVIAYACDPLSPIREAFYGKEDRILIEAYRAVNKDDSDSDREKFYKVKAIREAMEVYTDWCNTPTAQIITKSKEMYLKSISDLHEIVMGGLVVGEEGIGTKGGEMSVQDMIKSIKEVPDIIKDHINMKTIQQKDVAEVKMKIKGETPLTRGELKVIQRASTK